MTLPISELINRIDAEEVQFQMLNESIVELRRANSKRKAGTITFATEDSVVANQMTAEMPDRMMLLVVGATEWNRVVKQLRDEGLIK